MDGAHRRSKIPRTRRPWRWNGRATHWTRHLHVHACSSGSRRGVAAHRARSIIESRWPDTHTGSNAEPLFGPRVALIMGRKTYAQMDVDELFAAMEVAAINEHEGFVRGGSDRIKLQHKWADVYNEICEEINRAVTRRCSTTFRSSLRITQQYVQLRLLGC